MPQGTCVVSDCANTGKMRRGMCSACWQWAQSNPGKDPAGRPRRPVNPSTDGRCVVAGCETGGRLKRGMCSGCYQWAQKNPRKDPATRPRPVRAPADGQCTVVEGGMKCTREHSSHGMCRLHRDRQRLYGDPLLSRQRVKGVLLQDLRAAAHATTDECVILAGYSNRPYVSFRGVTTAAARAVWIIRHGDPGEANVLHTCNGGSGENGCINIRHLYAGTKAENIRDAIESGRWNPNPRRGSDVVTHVLEDDDVRTIRARWAAEGITQKALAAEYGVSRALLSLIVNRKRWRHLK